MDYQSKMRNLPVLDRTQYSRASTYWKVPHKTLFLYK